LMAIGPATLPQLNEIGIDSTFLVFCIVVSVFAGLLFGLIPTLKHAGPHLIKGLRGGGRTMSHSRERHRARNVLVVVQIALALILLVSCGLMIRTFAALRSVQPGFSEPEHVQMF